MSTSIVLVRFLAMELKNEPTEDEVEVAVAVELAEEVVVGMRLWPSVEVLSCTM